MGLVEWSEKHFVLSSEYASEPGRFRVSRTPWLERPMMEYTSPKVSRQVLMFSNQCGKSLYLMAIFGRTAHIEPRPIIFGFPRTKWRPPSRESGLPR